MEKPVLNQTVQSLIDTVKQVFDGEVAVEFTTDTVAGYVRHDQAQTTRLDHRILVTINDATAPDYTVAHELLHLLMALRGFPQLYFGLSSGNQDLDQQLMMMTTELYDIVAHQVVVQEQRKHGLITPEIETWYLKGVQATVAPESEKPDGRMTLRLLTLTDALVFFGDQNEPALDQLKTAYPKTFVAATKLYQLLLEKPVNSPFSMRRNVVRLFKAFDQQLRNWQLSPLNSREFATIVGVFSERQLRLHVRQLFELFHSEMVDPKTKRRAYVGLSRSDGQNAFVITAPKQSDDRPEYFTALYDLTVAELLNQLELPVLVRK